ncbi:MOSC domain-containing protein [Variovorax sp. LT1R16]|uniref:MOSC domain-containing protein n=1 Tax=Variovorax sp. LT1R16 TaxID=3443728 RepID=UPI003F4748C4
MDLASNIDLLFAGGLSFLEPEGQRTGIYKRRISGPVRVEPQGIVGDEHGDRRVHGGPEKAVHHYAAGNYALLARAFPASAPALVPGSLGENISAHHLSELNVHLGDVFRIGSVALQVSQPRSPCWKINHRFDAERMSMFVAQERITGWYYRVVEGGSIQPGDRMELVDRRTDRFSIDEFWRVQLCHRPCVDDVLKLIAVPGLAEEWKRRLAERMKWLQKQAVNPP